MMTGLRWITKSFLRSTQIGMGILFWAESWESKLDGSGDCDSSLVTASVGLHGSLCFIEGTGGRVHSSATNLS